MRRLLTASALTLILIAAAPLANAESFLRLETSNFFTLKGAGPTTEDPVKVTLSDPDDVRFGGQVTVPVQVENLLDTHRVSVHGAPGATWVPGEVPGVGSVVWSGIPAGTHRVDVRVSDEDGTLEDSESFGFEAVGDFSVSLPTTSYSVLTGETLVILPATSNVLGQAVYWGASIQLPGWLTLNDRTGALSVDTSAARSISGVVLTAVDQGDMTPRSTAPIAIEVRPNLSEASRTTENQSELCGTGFTGQQTRSREVIEYSDESTFEGPWSNWDRSQCVAIVVTHTYVQSESALCGTGFTGNQSRSRNVDVYSNGVEAPGSWSLWNRDQCVAIESTGSYVETATQACGTGMSGVESRTRTVETFSDGSTVPGAWGAWDKTACSPLVVDSHIYKRQALVSCPNGSYTTRTYGTLKKKMYSGAIVSEPEYTISTQACPTSSSTRTVYHYGGTCSLFGYQTRTLQEWYVKLSSGKWTITETRWSPSVTCAKY